jgi:hypothetical protein
MSAERRLQIGLIVGLAGARDVSRLGARAQSHKGRLRHLNTYGNTRHETPSPSFWPSFATLGSRWPRPADTLSSGPLVLSGHCGCNAYLAGVVPSQQMHDQQRGGAGVAEDQTYVQTLKAASPLVLEDSSRKGPLSAYQTGESHGLPALQQDLRQRVNLQMDGGV